MLVSVVIATRNRKTRLLSLLESLSRSTYPIHEVIIVDSSDEKLEPAEYSFSEKLNVICISSEPSVCIQRNIGIKAAAAPWIFICDDDIEVPDDYLEKIAAHIHAYPEAGAVSGLFLQKENGKWQGSYPVRTGKELLLKYVFQLGMWGEIVCRQDNFILRHIKAYYTRKGNHISKAGWPVITAFGQPHIGAPVYTLGAAVVRKDWLLSSPFDEVLDRHGIGDNYGVATGFPILGVQLLKDAFVYHHQEPANRLKKPLQYYRRALALDYFLRTKPHLRQIKRHWLLWSLLGNAVVYVLSRDSQMIKPALKTFWRIARGINPYYDASKKAERIAEPML